MMQSLVLVRRDLCACEELSPRSAEASSCPRISYGGPANGAAHESAGRDANKGRLPLQIIEALGQAEGLCNACELSFALLL
jgi:hypothetical protein